MNLNPALANLFHRAGTLFFVALLVLPFLAPYHTAPIPSFYHEWLAGIGILGTALLLFGKRPPVQIDLPALAWFFVLMIILLIIQILAGQMVYPSQGRLAIMYMLGALLLLLSTHRLRQTIGLDKLTILFAWCLLVTALLGDIAAVLQFWEIHTWLDPYISTISHGRAYGNLAQPNHFCDHQALALVALYFLIAKRQIPGWLGICLTLPLLVGMTLSQSKSVWGYLLIVILSTTLFHVRRRSTESRMLLALTLAGLPALLVMQYLLHATSTTTDTVEQVTTLATTGGSTLQARLVFMREAWQAFLSHPLAGVGFQQLSWQHFVQQAAHPDPVFFATSHLYADNVHNLVLQFLAEFGVTGGILLAGLGYWLYRIAIDNPDLPHWMIMTMLGILTLHSMVEYPLFYLHFLALAVVLAGMANGPTVGRISQGLVTGLALPTLVLGAILLTGMYLAYGYLEDIYGGSSRVIRLDATTQYKLIRGDAGGFFESHVDHIISLVPINFGNQTDKAMQLKVSERITKYRPTAERVYRYILLLAVNDRMKESAGLLAMAARAYPKDFMKFKVQVRDLLAKWPDDKGLQALSLAVEESK